MTRACPFEPPIHGYNDNIISYRTLLYLLSSSSSPTERLIKCGNIYVVENSKETNVGVRILNVLYLDKRYLETFNNGSHTKQRAKKISA